LRAIRQRYREEWRATVDEDGHYSFAVAMMECDRIGGSTRYREASGRAATPYLPLSQK
jgi:hypothetical protein